MQFNIAAFTHKGTSRLTNQDHILINGKIWNDVEISLTNEQSCVCFVADGVGGNNAGEFASEFILEKIAGRGQANANELAEAFREINQQLLTVTAADLKLAGAATTLTGVVIREHKLFILHAGDSQLWMFRNEMLLKLTTDHVVDEAEPNSPITNYFGGAADYLTVELLNPGVEIFRGDIFMLCSDGILKAMNNRSVKVILNSGAAIEEQMKKIRKQCLEQGAIDNISLILIQPVI